MPKIQGKLLGVQSKMIKSKSGDFEIRKVWIMEDGIPEPQPVICGDKIVLPDVGKNVDLNIYAKTYQTKTGGSGFEYRAYVR